MHSTETDQSGEALLRASLSAPGGNQPTITNIVQRELDDFEQRIPRRARIVGRLVFLQVALLLAVAPLALWPHVQYGLLGVYVAGLLLYGLAWIRNISLKVTQAQIILVAGSGLVTAAAVLSQFIAPQFSAQQHLLSIGLASFPFLLTILEAALLFGPELVIVTAVLSTAFTAVTLAAALLAPGEVLSPNESYLLAVMTLGLQALAGLIGWQIARFIQDYSNEVALAHREEFIVMQYDALRRGIEEQSARTLEQVSRLVNAILELSSRNYTVRVTLPEGDLRPIADVLNVLAEELGRLVLQRQVSDSEDEALHRIAGIADDIARGEMNPAPLQPSIATTATGSLLQGTLITLARARVSMQRRLGHVRDLAIDAGQRLNQIDEHGVAAEHVLGQNQGTIGLLRSEANQIATSASRLNQLIDATLTALGDLVPPEVRAQARIASSDTSGSGLQQVMPGVTVQLDIITDETELGPAELPSASGLPPGPSNALGDAHAQVKLREAWRLIIEMTEEVAKQVRDAQVLEDKLGIASKSLRGLDTDLRQTRNALASVRQIAEQVYHQASSTNTHPLTGPLPDVLPRPNQGTPPSGISAADLLSGTPYSVDAVRPPYLSQLPPDSGSSDPQLP